MSALFERHKRYLLLYTMHRGDVALQVATEWLFSVPDHILHKHLASDPNTPVAEVSTPEDHRVCAPRRVALQVHRAPIPALRLWLLKGLPQTLHEKLCSARTLGLLKCH